MNKTMAWGISDPDAGTVAVLSDASDLNGLVLLLVDKAGNENRVHIGAILAKSLGEWLMAWAKEHE